jgi:hypothetical protein
MVSSIVPRNIHPWPSKYTTLHSTTEGSAPLGKTDQPSSSWKRYLQPPTQRPRNESTTIPAAITTTEGPTVLQPASTAADIDVQKESFFRFLDELESGAYAADEITDEE